MMKQQSILLAMGTRPEIIKMVPVYNELKARGQRPILLHTGQHTDMASSLYELFGIQPDYAIDLDRDTAVANNDNALSRECALSSLSSMLLQKISGVIGNLDISAVLVHGDTSSALMAALAAFYKKVPVAHIEAGLRSHNDYNPFPEEMNRVLIAQLAHWHFAPTARAKQNLLSEGVDESHIHVVGNTIVEAAQLGMAKLAGYRKRNANAGTQLIDSIEPRLLHHKMIVVTAHRRENQEANVRKIALAVQEILQKHSDMIVVWPVHPNPAVKSVVYSVMESLPESVRSRLYLTEPLDYPVLLWALKNAWLTLTDSGGIQEEAVAVSTPALVLRETTERPEIIEAGAGMLIGTEKSDIVSQVNMLYRNSDRYDAMCHAKNPFGDGTTASMICSILTKRDASETGDSLEYAA